MLGSKLLSKKKSKSKIVLKFERLFDSFGEFYYETLNYWIKKPKTIVWFMIFVVAFAGFLFKLLQKLYWKKIQIEEFI